MRHHSQALAPATQSVGQIAFAFKGLPSHFRAHVPYKKHPQHTPTSRIITSHMPTLDLLNPIILIPSFLARGFVKALFMSVYWCWGCDGMDCNALKKMEELYGPQAFNNCKSGAYDLATHNALTHCGTILNLQRWIISDGNGPHIGWLGYFFLFFFWACSPNPASLRLNFGFVFRGLHPGLNIWPDKLNLLDLG